MRLAKLFEPLKVGSMQLKNRIAMTGFPITTAEDTSKLGIIHQRYIDFYENMARGGVGLIILPDTCVDRNLRFLSHPCIGGDEFNPGLSALTEAVHTWGTKIAPDLWHHDLLSLIPGWHPAFPYGNDWRPLSTSPLSFKPQRGIDMSVQEIQEVEDLFADAALRAKKTGFDAIHLAGHFGFLINHYLSPFFNKRNDIYGGSLENRMRLAIEIIQKIKDKIADALPIIFRLSADELVQGGLTIEDTTTVAQRLQDAGVDMLNVIAGLLTLEEFSKIIPPMGSPEGPYVELAAKIKKAVDIPVIAAGRITEPQFAEEILNSGKADIVGMARQLVADPEWPVKAAWDRFTDIAPCIGCNVCLQRLNEKMVSRCSVNAALGREREFRLAPTPKPLSVMVVGGGPAGLEAARIAALRGHAVSLYEKDQELGGQLILSAKPPYKDEIRKFREYLIRQAVKAGVEIKLGVEVTEAIVKTFAPDVVVLATGVLPLRPEIPGALGRNVVTAWDVLSGIKVGKRVVIIGGGMVGCETAEHLLEGGHKVSIVEMLSQIASDLEPYTVRKILLERLSKYDGLGILVNSQVERVIGKSLVIRQNGDEKIVDANTVVLAMGAVPNSVLARKLRYIVPNLFEVGDCVKPGRIEDAINHAAWVARQI